MEYRERRTSAFWYLLGGAVVGTVAGLLLAPKAGIDTREDLQDWRRQARERARSLINRLPSRVKIAAAAGAIKSGTSEAFTEAKEKATRQFGS